MFGECSAPLKLLAFCKCPILEIKILALKVFNNLTRYDVLRRKVGNMGLCPVLIGNFDVPVRFTIVIETFSSVNI